MRASRIRHAVTNGVSHGPVTPCVTVPPTRPDPTRTSVVALVCGSRWSKSESEVTVTKGRGIGFGTGQNR